MKEEFLSLPSIYGTSSQNNVLIEIQKEKNNRSYMNEQTDVLSYGTLKISYK